MSSGSGYSDAVRDAHQIHCGLYELARAVALSVGLGLALIVAPIASAQPENPLVPLVDAAAQRLQVAEPIAATKLLDGGLIQDPAREQQVLDAVAAAATERNIDRAYVTNIFRDQIDATVAIEYSRLSQWKLDPASAPLTAPDLSSSRAAIDGLNWTMVTEMADEWQELHSPMCLADLDAAKNLVAQARAMDPLYRQAVDFVTRNYCR